MDYPRVGNKYDCMSLQAIVRGIVKKGDTLILSQIYVIVAKELNDMAKKELKQIVMSWHKAAGVTVGWQEPVFSYVSDDDYEIVAIDMEIEAYATDANTQVLGAQLSYDAEAFDSLTGSIQDAARRRCLMSLNTNSLIVTSGGTNFWRGKTIVFPSDARPHLDEDDQMNLHIYSSTADKGGQITAILHVKPR